MKRALVHEWFDTYGGSEKVVESFLTVWDDFDVFSLVDNFDDALRQQILKGKKPVTSFIQRLPFSKTRFRYYLPFYPFAIEQLNLTPYDIVLSNSHSVAKGVLTRESQLHICYCHSPMRYAWDLYHQYMYQDNFERGIRGYVIKRALHNLRTWDVISTARVDYFLCNSLYTARRIKKTYGREADVLYPPVEVDKFSVQSQKEEYYFAVSRLVPYKRIDLIVSAFNAMPDKKLVVAGSGPDLDKIKAIAGKNVEILGYIPQDQLLKYMQGAKAFVFAALEDFGIVNVEAMACGTPVIALDHGGSAESVIDGVTGVHFSEQTEVSMIDAVKRFEAKQDSFDPEVIRRHAELFSRTSFEQKIKKYIDEKAEDFFNRKKNRSQSEARII